MAAQRRGRSPITVSDQIRFVPGPGFTGRVVVRPPKGRPRSAKRAGRARRSPAAAIDASLISTGFSTLREVEVRPGRRPARTTRAAGGGARFEIDTKPDEIPIALVESDGVMTWRFATPRAPGRVARGTRAPKPGRSRWAIDVPRRMTRRLAPRDRRPRGLLAVAAGMVVKFLVFKIAKVAAGKLLEVLVRAHEKKHIAPGLKPVANGRFADPAAPAGRIAPAPGARILVFVHGTFSTCRGGFAGLEGRPLRDLERMYGGHVYGFDHWSVSKSPLENMREFLDAVAPLGPREVDFVAHSRGGLVCRAIAEMGRSRPITPRRAVLVGTPNGGTPLADPKRLGDCLNFLTTSVNLVPGAAGLFVLDIIFGAVQWLAKRGVGELPGLVPQSPSSEFLARLNSPKTVPIAQYAAITANYEPDDGLLGRLKDTGMDLLFAADNDLVVPTASIITVDPAADPPPLVGERVLYFSGGTVHHCNYFSRRETVSFLKQVLAGPPP